MSCELPSLHQPQSRGAVQSSLASVHRAANKHPRMACFLTAATAPYGRNGCSGAGGAPCDAAAVRELGAGRHCSALSHPCRG